MLKIKADKLFAGFFILLVGFALVITSINIPFIFLLVLAYFAYIVSYKTNIKGFGFIIFGLALLIRVICVLMIQTPAISDFKLIYDAAAGLSRGDLSFNSIPYFRDWAYQTGFVAYESMVISIFGLDNAQIALKILNSLFDSGSCLLIYMICRSFVRDKISRFISLLSVVALFPIMFVTVLSNQQIATFFFLLGLFAITDNVYLTKVNTFFRHFFAGIFLAIGNIMRPEGIIIVTSIFVIAAMRLIKPEHEKRTRIILETAIIIVIYLGVNLFASRIIINSGINNEGLKNNYPLWKFVVGLNSKTNGLYSEEDCNKFYRCDITKDERDELATRIIKERLKKSVAGYASLFAAKQQSLWGGDPVFWSYHHINRNDKLSILSYMIPADAVFDRILSLHHSQIVFLLFLSFMSGVSMIKKLYDKKLLLYYCILMIFTAAYLFIEVQPRYFYIMEFFLFITAAKGAERGMKFLRVLDKRHRHMLK